MKRHRYVFLLTLVLALGLAVVAAGCGGDDDEGGEGAATTGGEAASGVSGNISILALWTSGEQKSFEAVLDGFKQDNPDVKISYKSAEDVAPVLSTAIQGGNPCE